VSTNSTTTANQRIDQQSPVVLLKACKNAAELHGMRACHLRDGAAVVEFLAALDAHFHPQQQGQGGNGEAAAATPLSEVQLADKLQAFRARCEKFVGPSFDTIAGVNENGAIIHYR
jgi:Xaa-Pro aminopeptidase